MTAKTLVREGLEKIRRGKNVSFSMGKTAKEAVINQEGLRTVKDNED